MERSSDTQRMDAGALNAPLRIVIIRAKSEERKRKTNIRACWNGYRAHLNRVELALMGVRITSLGQEKFTGT